jgi:demethylmenaquinone methyltransferase/2-methoxy-6-polyprenyl-1,4-benzoquinol methylase
MPSPALRPATPQAVFDRVARRYDLLNRSLSLGLDRAWRRRAARLLDVPPEGRVLDVATGTASLALELAKAASAGARIVIVGCDRNQAMLGVARERLRRARSAVRLIRCAAEAIPFGDCLFDRVAVAFAIDDLDDQTRAAREIFRVLVPGGRVVILELSLPASPLGRASYRLLLRCFPLVDRVLGQRAAYAHLREEILGYRGESAVGRLLADAGFVGHERERVTGGVAMIHAARRPC